MKPDAFYLSLLRPFKKGVRYLGALIFVVFVFGYWSVAGGRNMMGILSLLKSEIRVCWNFAFIIHRASCHVRNDSWCIKIYCGGIDGSGFGRLWQYIVDIFISCQKLIVSLVMSASIKIISWCTFKSSICVTNWENFLYKF